MYDDDMKAILFTKPACVDKPGKSMNVIRVLLVDDQLTVRRGLSMRLALEPDMLVVGEANDAEEAFALTQTCSPDVVLMDVEMPAMDGIAATQVLHTEKPSLAIVIMSIHDDVVTQTRAKTAGAFAFLSKNEATELLLTTLRQAAQQAS